VTWQAACSCPASSWSSACRVTLPPAAARLAKATGVCLLDPTALVLLQAPAAGSELDSCLLLRAPVLSAAADGCLPPLAASLAAELGSCLLLRAPLLPAAADCCWLAPDPLLAAALRSCLLLSAPLLPPVAAGGCSHRQCLFYPPICWPGGCLACCSRLRPGIVSTAALHVIAAGGAAGPAGPV